MCMKKAPRPSSLCTWINLLSADVGHLITDLIEPDRLPDEPQDHLSGACVVPISGFHRFDRLVKNRNYPQAPGQTAGLASGQYMEPTEQRLGQRHVDIFQCGGCGQSTLLSVEKVVDTKLSGQTMPCTRIARYAKKLSVQSGQEDGAFSPSLNLRRFCRRGSKAIRFSPQSPNRKSSKERYTNAQPCDQKCACSHRNAQYAGHSGERFPPDFTSPAQWRALKNAFQNTHSLIPQWTRRHSAMPSRRAENCHG